MKVIFLHNGCGIIMKNAPSLDILNKSDRLNLFEYEEHDKSFVSELQGCPGQPKNYNGPKIYC